MTIYAVILIGVLTGIIETASASSYPGIDAGNSDTAIGTLGVKYYDPKDGYYTEGKIATDGGSESFTPPFSGDAVLHISIPASSSETTGKWDIYEIPLETTNTHSNPYKDVTLSATFNGQNGKEIKIEGFWDGGNTWKIRMAPTGVGIWTYTTTSNDDQLNGRTGSFNCVESGNKGFIKVNADYPHTFMYDDGTPFLMKMTAMCVHAGHKGGGIFAYGGWMPDGSFQTHIDTRATQGFNAMHWGMIIDKWGLYEGRNVQENEGGQPFQDMDLRNPINPDYFQWTDKRVEYALSKGIIPQFGIVWPDTQPPGGSHESYKRLWRYVIARYSAYQVTWDLFGEGNEWGTDSIPREYGLLTKEYDPYSHPLSYHTTRDGNKGDAWLDFIILQDETSAVSPNLQYDKPVINAEYKGYDDCSEEDYGADDDTIRKKVWDIRMRGGYPVYETWGDDLTTPAVDYVSKMWNFFDDKEFWLLDPHHELVNSGLALANPGEEYIVYLQDGGSVTVDLSNATGTLNVEWYNPKDGTYYDEGTITGGGSETFTPPFSGDAVLHIVSPVFDIDEETCPSMVGTSNITTTIDDEQGESENGVKPRAIDIIRTKLYNLYKSVVKRIFKALDA
jgi:hypothetical protein